MSVLDLLFPKKCVGCKKAGEYICPSCFATISYDVEKICTVCNRASLDGKTHPVCHTKYTLDGIFAAVAYKGVIKKLLYQLKYQPYLTDVIPDLADLCYEALIQDELFNQILKEKPIFVPIPLSSNRLRKRGYNQAELLAKALGKRFDLPVQNLLKRVKDTKPQYGLKREERQENMKDAFALTKHVIANKAKQSSLERKIAASTSSPRNDNGIALLVDDVLTTGSTMQEAAKILKKNGFTEVWGIALAKD